MRRRVTVERGGSPVTRWEMAAGTVDVRLRPLLEPYGGFEERSARPVLRREVPHPRVVVVLGLGDGLTVSPGGHESSARRVSSFAAGLTAGPTLVAHEGAQRCVELRLTPLGAYRLLGVPMSSIAGRAVDLTDLWGRQAAELAERLAEAPDWDTRFGLLEDVLLRRAAEGPDPTPELAAAWHRIERHHGDLTIGELLNDTGWSRRRLAQRFREQVGLTPKEAARVVRFARAADLIGRQENHSLAAIAAHCGFYDQAHLNRDFRALAGCTPTEHRAARLLPALPGTGP